MNQVLDSILIALQAIWANKLRSFMTVLGNIVAVTSIVTVVTLIQGMNGMVADAIVSDIGADIAHDRVGNHPVHALNERDDGDDRRHRDDVAEHRHERSQLVGPDGLKRDGDGIDDLVHRLFVLRVLC